MEVTGLSRASIRANKNADTSLENALTNTNKGRITPTELELARSKSLDQNSRIPAQTAQEQASVETKASIVVAANLPVARGLAIAETKSDAKGLDVAEEKTGAVERILPENLGRNLDTTA